MDIDAPLRLHTARVLPEWIDYNGHMNVAYYVLAFDHATDDFFDYVGLTEDYRSAHDASAFALECHVTYLRELHEGDAITITTQLLDHDAKRMHFFHFMHHGEQGHLVATSEWINTHVDTKARRSSPFGAPVLERLEAVMAAHAPLPRPEHQGRLIGISR